jgi:hypothetical protein
MKKPNAEVYAKVVLWHLAALRAEVGELQIQVASILANQTGQTTRQVLDELRQQTRKETKTLYHDAIREAGLD